MAERGSGGLPCPTLSRGPHLCIPSTDAKCPPGQEALYTVSVQPKYLQGHMLDSGPKGCGLCIQEGKVQADWQRGSHTALGVWRLTGAPTGQHHKLPTPCPFSPSLFQAELLFGAAVCPVKRMHSPDSLAARDAVSDVSGILLGTSGRVLISCHRPSLFYLPLSCSCSFADVKIAVDHLSYSILRMEEQKDRRTWDPRDITPLLCQPCNAYLWTCGSIDKITHSLVKPLVSFCCHGSQTQSWVIKLKLLLSLRI